LLDQGAADAVLIEDPSAAAFFAPMPTATFLYEIAVAGRVTTGLVAHADSIPGM